MKKLLVAILIAIPAMAFSQTQYLSVGGGEVVMKDTITNERDTLIKHRVSADYTWSWHVLADTLEGTLDGLIEVYVANYDPRSTPPDSAFIRLEPNVADTLSSTGAYSYWDADGSPYMWSALKITQNSITKWDLSAYFVLRKK